MSYQFISLITAGGGIGIVALAFGTRMAHLMVSILFALFVFAYINSRFSLRNLGWDRQARDRVFEHETAIVTIKLTNRGWLPRTMLTAIDRMPDFLEADEDPMFTVPVLWPGEQVALSYQVRARKRGVYQLGPIIASTSDPFGIFQRKHPLEAQGEVIIYPRPIPLSADLGRRGYEPRGYTTGERTQVVESGLEFYGIRDYQPGDELRRIHWPSTAHHGRLSVIEYERGASGSFTVILDAMTGTEAGSGEDTTLEVGVKAASSLLDWGLSGEGMVGLAFDSAEGPRWLSVERRDQEYVLLEALAKMKADGTMPVSQVMDWINPGMPAGATAVVITAAPDDALLATVESFQQRRIFMIVVLLDASSFESTTTPSAFNLARLAGNSQRGDREIKLSNLILELEAIGARAVRVRRGDDLAVVLGEVLYGSY